MNLINNVQFLKSQVQWTWVWLRKQEMMVQIEKK